MEVRELPRRIGFWGGSAIMVGIIIGSGIFRAPPVTAQYLDSAGVILGLWVAGGVLSFFGALTYAELAAAFPRSGGPYVYLNEGIGPRSAFVFGWSALLLIKPLAAAGIAFTFAENLNILFRVSWPEPAVACGMILALTALNSVSMRGSSGLALVLTGLKIAALLAIVVLGVAAAGTSAAATPAGPPKPWLGVAPALFAILWAYDGWADITPVAGEVRDPQRLIPRIMFFGTAFIVVLYVAVNAVYFSRVPLGEMQSMDSVAPAVMERLVGPAGATIVAAMIVLSTLGATHGSILVGARVTFAQARDGLLFRFLGRVHPRYETPDVSLWVQAAFSCAAILLFKRFETVVEGYGFVMWLFHALNATALFRLRALRPELARPFRCWGYPVVPALFIASALGMTTLEIVRAPKLALPWLGILLLGVPAYSLWKRFAKPLQ